MSTRRLCDKSSSLTVGLRQVALQARPHNALIGKQFAKQLNHDSEQQP